MEQDLESDFLNVELSEQRAMNRQAWLMLVKKGYSPEKKLHLDFVFVTPSRANAKKLQKFLQELGCQAKVINNDDEFEISGKTPEMSLSLEDLHVWTAHMAEYGQKYNCIFDGWSTDAVMKR